MRYDPEVLFRSTAPFYARYRSGYPPQFFEHLVDRFGLDGTQAVMDLGCGTGQIALDLAPHVATVCAVDPEPTMLVDGRRIAAERGLGNVTWTVGDSYRLGDLQLPELALVTMGASFHWMDRDAVLTGLDTLIGPGGAVVVASGGASALDPPPWNDTMAAVRAKYLGPERRAGSTTYTHPEERHEDLLRRSGFSQVESVEWVWTLDRDLESVVGLQFSLSYSAPSQFDGEQQREAFEADLREALAIANPSGQFREEIRTEALIATRA